MKKALLFVLGILGLLLAWQSAAVLTAKPWIVPFPAKAFEVVLNAVSRGNIFVPIWQTLWKVAAALMISTLLGIPAGYILGRNRELYSFFRPWIMVAQAVPVISWLAIVFFSWGVGWKGPVFISSLALLPISVLTTVAGVRDRDVQLLEMAAVYQVPKRKIIRSIWIGSLIPYILAVLDVSIGQAWKVMLVTEYLCGGKGLGEEIMISRMNIDTARAWGFTFVAVVLGIGFEFVIKGLTRRVLEHAGLPESV